MIRLTWSSSISMRGTRNGKWRPHDNVRSRPGRQCGTRILQYNFWATHTRALKADLRTTDGHTRRVKYLSQATRATRYHKINNNDGNGANTSAEYGKTRKCVVRHG